MDGENHGLNPMNKWDEFFGGKTHLFSETPDLGKMLHPIFDDLRICGEKTTHHRGPSWKMRLI